MPTSVLIRPIFGSFVPAGAKEEERRRFRASAEVRRHHGQARSLAGRCPLHGLSGSADYLLFGVSRVFLPETSPFQGRLGGRFSLATEAKAAGKTVITYNTDLERKGDDDLRCAQLETLDDARRYDANVPIVLAGDFSLDVSEGAGSAALHQAKFGTLSQGQHLLTTPDALLAKGRVIDWIFTRGPTHSSEPRVHRLVKASDHFPL